MKLHSCLLTLLFVVFPAVDTRAGKDDTARIDLEAQISLLLSKEISKLLPEKSFAIVTDLSLASEEVKVLNESEKTEKSVDPAGIPPEVELLPGFVKPEGIVPPAAGSSEREVSEKFSINKEMIVKTIKVTLLLDKSLNPEKKQLAKQIVTNKITENYGQRGSVSVKEADLLEPPTPLPKDEFNSSEYVLKRLDYILACSALFVLLILLALILRPRGSRIPAGAATAASGKAAAGAHKGKGGGGEGAGTSETAASNLKVLDDIIWHVDTYPLIARKFLQKTSNQERNAIFANLNSAVTKEVFAQLFGEDLADIELSIRNSGANYDEEDLAKLASSLNQYVKVQKFLEQRKFGYLNFVSTHELGEALQHMSADEKAILLPHLSPEQAQHFLATFSIPERAALIKNLSDAQAHDPLREQQLDLKLRQLFNAAMQEVFTAHQEHKSPIEFILENDPNVADVVALLTDDEKFAGGGDLGKYKTTFDDLLALEDDKLSAVISHCENEEIATALSGKPQEVTDKVLNLLSPMRKHVVENLLLHRSEDERIIAEAQNKVLKHFRALT